MDSKAAWEQFNRSGSVGAYLHYKFLERKEQQENQYAYQGKGGRPPKNSYLG